MNNHSIPSCYIEGINLNSVWGTGSAIVRPIPVLFLQMAIVVGSNLLFSLLLKNFNQPRIVRDLLSALVVSPFMLDFINKPLSTDIWPRMGNTNVRILGNIGILYCVFMKGVQMDLSPITNRRGKKTLFLSCGIILIPFFIGCALYDFFSKREIPGFRGKAMFVYWGAALASSSFPTLASILARLKLLSTNIGRESLCICMINDLVSWALMVLVIALSALPHPLHLEAKSWEPVMVVFLYVLIFSLFCYFVIRHCIQYYITQRKKDGENYEDHVVHFMLMLVMLSGIIAEFFGAYGFLGAFFLGLAVPPGAFAQTLVERMEGFVSILLMPLYCVTIGIRLKTITFTTLLSNFNIALAATILKPLCVYLFSLLFRLSQHDAFSYAVLLNTKGLQSLAIAVVGFERKHLTKEGLSVLVLIVLLSTSMAGPIMSLYYKRVMTSNRPYKYSNVQGIKPDGNFRVMACLQETQNIRGIFNLLEISLASKRLTVSVFGVHLMELIGKVSAMLIVHQASGNDSDSSDNPFFSRKSAQLNQIATAFKNFQQKHIDTTTVKTLTVVSPMDSMHEDIINIAEDKEVSMIMLSYHMRQGMDGKLEDGDNIEFSTVNQNVMRTAPCSVGLLIDRSNGMIQLADTYSTNNSSGRIGSGEIRVAVLYIGGPDDREALSYALRLVRHPLIHLTLIRFIPGNNAIDVEPTMIKVDENGTRIEPVNTESEIEKIHDREFIERCLSQSENTKPIEYMKIISNNGEETTTRMREIEHYKFDLYVVGRGEQVYSSMTAGLAEWTENPELGVIGEMLVMSDFMENSSVLVVQQSLNARRAFGA